MNAEFESKLNLLSEVSHRVVMNRISWFMTAGTALSWGLENQLYGDYIVSPYTIVGLGLTIASVLGSISLNCINRTRNIIIEAILKEQEEANGLINEGDRMPSGKLENRPGTAH